MTTVTIDKELALRVLEAVPKLGAVIAWLDNGCSPKEAANELRLYETKCQAAITDLRAAIEAQPQEPEIREHGMKDVRFGGRCQKHPLNIIPCEQCGAALQPRNRVTEVQSAAELRRLVAENTALREAKTPIAWGVVEALAIQQVHEAITKLKGVL